MLPARVSLAGIIVALTACGLSVTGEAPLDGGAEAGADASALDDVTVSDGSPSSDSSDATDSSATDSSDATDGGGSSDATDGSDGGLPGVDPVVIASGGTVAAPTGHAQQTHLVYAEHARRWWLFTIDSAASTALETYWSSDFVTWSPGSSLTLPFGHAGAGGNFSVAYADLGGADVVHLAIGFDIAANDKRHYHARATISGSAITWGTPAQVVAVTDPALASPEGCSTTVTATGVVIDTTGWAPYSDNPTSTGNENAFVSVSADTGTTWSGGFGARKDIEPTTHTVNAHVGVALASGDVLVLWESASQEPDPANVRWTRLAKGGTFSSPADVFPNAPQGWNDWCAARLADTDVHIVRRQTTGAFDHRRWDGATWQAGSAVPALAMPADRGLVLLHDASRVALVGIAADGAASVMGTTWTSGAWSAWTSLAGAPAKRSNVSGFSSPTAGSAVVWTETSAGTTHVVGRRIAL